MKQAKSNDLMGKLVLLIQPDMPYPVSYLVNNKGEKTRLSRPTLLLGKDLTENQIYELYEKGIIDLPEDSDVDNMWCDVRDIFIKNQNALQELPTLFTITRKK